MFLVNNNRHLAYDFTVKLCIFGTLLNFNEKDANQFPHYDWKTETLAMMKKYGFLNFVTCSFKQVNYEYICVI